LAVVEDAKNHGVKNGTHFILCIHLIFDIVSTASKVDVKVSKIKESQ